MDTFKESVAELDKRNPRISRVYFYPTTASTNEEAIKLGKSGSPTGTLIVADGQTEGKGRWNRHWESPRGKGLYFTLLIRPPLKPAEAQLLTLAAGLALGKTLRKFSLPPLLIKWPNDIWIEGKKVAGILTEMVSLGNKVDFVIIGIGLNVHQDEDDFPEEIRPIAGSLKLISPEAWDRAKVLEILIQDIFEEINLLLEKGSGPLVEIWEKESRMVGKKIRAQLDGNEVIGKVRGLNDQGHLKLEKESGDIIALIAEETTVIK